MSAKLVAPPAAQPAFKPPPFKIGDQVVFNRHPDGIELVLQVEACPFGRHHMLTERQLADGLVRATRWSRTSDFRHARPGDQRRGWQRRVAVSTPFMVLTVGAAGSWVLAGAVAVAALWKFNHG
jgi:hypothetical protein